MTDITVSRVFIVMDDNELTEEIMRTLTECSRVTGVSLATAVGEVRRALCSTPVSGQDTMKEVIAELDTKNKLEDWPELSPLDEKVKLKKRHKSDRNFFRGIK